ncbi:amidinotransferase [Candidatus Daviesbacteria bacterium]|nr:amidinotransferase [Candidatus Daviesbacteria bacterium]
MKNRIVLEVLMCRPTYYSISYTINPWMIPGSENKNMAQIQWENLVATYRSLGIKVNFLDQQQGLPDMVFSTDEGIVFKKKVVVSNFRYPQRRRERSPYLEWFEKHGFKPTFLPKGIFFEGSGDCLFFNHLAFVGTGFRTSKKAAEFLSAKLDIEVFPLQLINPYFFHLDTACFPLNSETAFYYPEAFDEKSQKILKKVVPNLIALTAFEARNFAANSVVTDHQVIINRNLPTFANTLAKLGYLPIEVDLNEFKKAGGAAHCLTNVLKEVEK